MFWHHVQTCERPAVADRHLATNEPRRVSERASATQRFLKHICGAGPAVPGASVRLAPSSSMRPMRLARSFLAVIERGKGILAKLRRIAFAAHGGADDVAANKFDDRIVTHA